MKWFGLQVGIVSVIFVVSLALADPEINNDLGPKNKETSLKRWWSLFGWNAPETRPGNTINGIPPSGPCFQYTTTTPQPLGPIPLCPLQPLPNGQFNGDGQGNFGPSGQLIPDQQNQVNPGRPQQVIPGQTGQFIPGQPDQIYPNRPGGFIPGQPGHFLPGQQTGFFPGQPGQFIPGEPGQVIPGQPGQVIPGQPGQVIPGQPGQVIPGQPGQVMPGQPGQVIPGQPGQVIPGKPGQVFPGQPGQVFPGRPGQVIPGQPGQVFPGQPGQVFPGQPGQVLPGQPGQALPDQPGQVFPGQPGQVFPGQPGQVYPGQPGQVYPGQPGQVLPGQPGQVLPGQPGQVLPGQPGQYIPGENDQMIPGQPGQFIPGGHTHLIPVRPGQLIPTDTGHVYPIVPVLPGSLRPFPTGPISEPSTNVPAYGGYCAGVPIGPIIPPGFFLADSTLQQQRLRDQCRPPPLDLPPCSMMEVLQQLRLRTVFTLIQQAGLEQLFLQTSKYTFFAPVDTAFERLPAWFMQSLRDDIKLLRAFLLNHFVKDAVSLTSIGNEYRVMNARAGGHRLRINVYHQEQDYRVYTVDGAKILFGEILTTNDGILHILDKVLVPNPPRLHAEYLSEIPEFKHFMNAVMESGLLPLFQDKDSPVTLFIPYNHAFKQFDYGSIAGNVAAVQNFVNFHTLNGTYFSSGLLHGQYLTTNYYKEIKMGVSTDGFTQYADTINGRIKILKADIPMLNGVAHVIEDCIIFNREFLFDAEVNEFSMDFGTFKKRSMTLNKKELEKEVLDNKP